MKEQLWVDKYRPESLDDIYGNNKTIKSLIEWSNDLSTNAVILHGPHGTGKTTAAHALANDKGWTITEINASDKRRNKDIEEILGAPSQSTLSNKKNLIILDEADNMKGHKAVKKLIRKSSRPLVIIVNDLYQIDNSLRNECKIIEFEEPRFSDLISLLEEICKSEDIDYSSDILKEIARDSDFRSAVNDLQSLSIGRDSISKGDYVLGDREEDSELFNFLDNLFKDNFNEELISEARGLDKNPVELIRWIENNVSKVYSNKELENAFKELSKADVWIGRTNKTQEYKFWKYALVSMVLGVAVSSENKNSGWTSYQSPQWKTGDSDKKHIAKKISKNSNVSTKVAQSLIIPYLSVMTHHCKNREATIEMTSYFNLTKQEVSEITGSGASTKKVEDILREANKK
jgi:replication factor C large subunit